MDSEKWGTRSVVGNGSTKSTQLVACSCCQAVSTQVSPLPYTGTSLRPHFIDTTRSGGQRSWHLSRWVWPDSPRLGGRYEVSVKQILHIRHPLLRRGTQSDFHGEGPYSPI